MDAERKVAAAIFLTAVGKHRCWKGEEIYRPKKPILFCISESLSRKGMEKNDENEAGEEV
jgi:hypothetical protein